MSDLECVINYDSDFDVLRILKITDDATMCYDDEVEPGIYFSLTEDTEECIAITIFDFKKKKKDWKNIQQAIPESFVESFIKASKKYL